MVSGLEFDTRQNYECGRSCVAFLSSLCFGFPLLWPPRSIWISLSARGVGGGGIRDAVVTYPAAAATPDPLMHWPDQRATCRDSTYPVVPQGKLLEFGFFCLVGWLGFFWVFFCFLGPYLRHMEFPDEGSNQSCSCQPTPQPQQHQI